MINSIQCVLEITVIFRVEKSQQSRRLSSNPRLGNYRKCKIISQKISLRSVEFLTKAPAQTMSYDHIKGIRHQVFINFES